MADEGVDEDEAGLRAAIEGSGSTSGAGKPLEGYASGCNASGVVCSEEVISICDDAADGRPRDGVLVTVAQAGATVSWTEVTTCCFGGRCANGVGTSCGLGRGSPSSRSEAWFRVEDVGVVMLGDGRQRA